MVHTQSDARLLTVRGSNKALDVLVFAQSACETCRGAALNLNSDNRVVNSLDLPGYHVDFTSGWSKAQREQAHKSPASEQIERCRLFACVSMTGAGFEELRLVRGNPQKPACGLTHA
jgi:hypothetical protein